MTSSTHLQVASFKSSVGHAHDTRVGILPPPSHEVVSWCATWPVEYQSTPLICSFSFGIHDLNSPLRPVPNTIHDTIRSYEALAQLQSLQSLTLSGARGDNATLEPLSALTGLSMLRVDLAMGFADADAGPLARLPALKRLGW